MSRMLARQLRKAMDLKNLLVINFLILFVNLFFVVMQINAGFWPVETFYQPAMTEHDKQVMVTTLRVFTTALSSANLTFFLYSGSLIGSYRHHGMIPWDDDTDMMLNASQKARVRDVLQSLRPDYDLYTGGSDDMTETTQWKFYSNHLSTFIHRPFKWPYIDIFFFREDVTHIWDEVPRFSDDYKFRKDQVFPLTKRPFEDMMLPAPCDPHGVLKNNYDITVCRSRSFSHMMEMPMFSFKTKDVPCTRLLTYFPFVYRTFIDGVMNESLRIADWTLQTHVLPSYCPGKHP
jgi:hypothetical protein